MKPSREGSRRFWIVRHGVSTFNASGRFQGSSDESQLTEEGRKAARLTAQYLSGHGIRSVITSPLQRARETALEILECARAHSSHSVAFDEDERLREIGLPAWEGLTFEEVRRRFPKQHETWKSSPQSMCMASAEVGISYPVLDLFERLRRFWDSLLPSAAGDVVVVTHAGAGRALINIALGLGSERFHNLQLSNCGVSLLKLSGAAPRCARLETLNATDHLGDRLPKLKEGPTGVRFLFIPAADRARERKAPVARILAGTSIKSAFVVGADEGMAGDFFPVPATFPVESVQPETLWWRVRTACACAGVSPATNVAVIGPASTLQPAFQKLLALENIAGGMFPLYPETITAVHCPGGGRQPVLQGMNLFRPAQMAVGVYA